MNAAMTTTSAGGGTFDSSQGMLGYYSTAVASRPKFAALWRLSIPAEMDALINPHVHDIIGHFGKAVALNPGRSRDQTRQNEVVLVPEQELEDAGHRARCEPKSWRPLEKFV